MANESPSKSSSKSESGGQAGQDRKKQRQHGSKFLRFSGLAGTIALLSIMVRVGDDAPAAPERANLAFRSYLNILQDCNGECFQRIRQDALAVGSDETYWLDHGDEDKDDTLLEHLTRSIFKHHCGDVEGCGGEWWIQIRDTGTIDKERTPLHFDKDETLMQEENRYAGPFLTCVTYLNEPSFPTVALDVKLNSYYDLVPNVTSNGTIAKAFLAVPSLGGHTVFDGSLLHGALVDERFALNTRLPKKRFVLVVSFWKDHSRPKSAGKVPPAMKKRLHKDQITAFNQNPKSLAASFDSKTVDGLVSLPGHKPSFNVFSFVFRHISLHYKKGKPSVQAIYKFRADLCLPTPEYIMKHRPQSYELHYGSKCQADLVNIELVDRTKQRGNKRKEVDWVKGHGSIVKISPLKRLLKRLQYSFRRSMDILFVTSLPRLSVSETKQYVESIIHRLAGR